MQKGTQTEMQKGSHTAFLVLHSTELRIDSFDVQCLLSLIRKREKTQRGTSLALSRFLFRFAIPAQIPPTDSDRIIA